MEALFWGPPIKKDIIVINRDWVNNWAGNMSHDMLMNFLNSSEKFKILDPIYFAAEVASI